MKKHKKLLKNRIIEIPLNDYKRYWSVHLIGYISPEYKHLFGNDKFYSLPELYSPTMTMYKTIHNQYKYSPLQMQINTIETPTGSVIDRYLEVDHEFNCSLNNYCKHWGLDNMFFKAYLAGHIFSPCLVKDQLLFPEHANPFHTFILLPTLYNKVYDYKELLKCFSHKPTIFNSDYYSFYDYSTLSGDKGKAITLTALYNMFDYKDLITLGFPKNSKKVKMARMLFGYETLSVLFLGYFHPERNNSVFYFDFAWDIKIVDYLKEKIEIKRGEDYINKFIYKTRQHKKNGN